MVVTLGKSVAESLQSESILSPARKSENSWANDWPCFGLPFANSASIQAYLDANLSSLFLGLFSGIAEASTFAFLFSSPWRRLVGTESCVP